MDNTINGLYLIEFINPENTDPQNGVEMSEFITFQSNDIDHAYEQLHDFIPDAKVIQVYFCNPLLFEIRI